MAAERRSQEFCARALTATLSFVVRRQLPAPSLISNEKFAADQVVAAHVVATQESVQVSRAGRPVRTGTGSRPRCRPGRSCGGMPGRGGALTSPSDLTCVWLRPTWRRRRRSYVPRRTSASRSSRTVSVTVFAPEAELASRKSRSSMRRVSSPLCCRSIAGPRRSATSLPPNGGPQETRLATRVTAKRRLSFLLAGRQGFY